MTDQTTFHTALRAPDQPVPAGLTGPNGTPANRRFNVYRNNVATSLMDALEDGFPVILKLLGPQNFRNVAREYQWQHPPTSPLMMHYGAGFPRFLAQMPQLAHLPYLADVARLELALRQSYHAADALPIDPTTLAALPPAALMAARVSLAPALRFLRSDWPLVSIWRFNMLPGAAKPQARAECALITRKDFDPTLHLITAADAEALGCLLQGDSLETALDAALRCDPAYGLTALLGILLTEHALTGLHPTEDSK